MKGLGFIGAGAMGEAMIKGVLAAKLLPPERIVVEDVRADRCAQLRERYGVAVAESPAALLGACDTVVLAVKPQVLAPVLAGLPAGGREGVLFLSIVAGATLSTLLAGLGRESAVVRAMPNTPAQVGMGAAGFHCSPRVTPAQKAAAMSLLSALGVVVELPKEELLDAVTALSGSGPAYAFLFVEALADGGVRAGLSREDALKLAAATVEGAARMVRETGMHPGQLKDLVMSPGGTTAAGVAALESGAFRGVAMSAVEAAWKRCLELGK
jgi:pyrroline-5-carboxylate reductase